MSGARRPRSIEARDRYPYYLGGQATDAADTIAVLDKYDGQVVAHVAVADATFAAARQALGNDRHLFEVIGVVAAYNMVSRILVAVDVQATD